VQAETDARRVGPNDILRLFLEIAAFGTLAVWGFLEWPGPWLNILMAIATPVFAILLWAFFLSPKAVIRLDSFGRALIEILIMGSAAIAWLSMGQPIVAAAFGVTAAVSGVISGRQQIR
jgi:hypothetical protein